MCEDDAPNSSQTLECFQKDGIGGPKMNQLTSPLKVVGVQSGIA